MSARKDLAAAVKAGVPADWKVLAYPTAQPGPAARPVVLVYEEDIEPHPAAPRGAWALSLKVWVLTTVTGSRGEDLLERARDKVLAALDPHTQFEIGKASRMSYQGTHSGWQIDITAAATTTT